MKQINITETAGKVVKKMDIVDNNLVTVFTDDTFVIVTEMGLWEVGGLGEIQINNSNISFEVKDYIYD